MTNIHIITSSCNHFSFLQKVYYPDGGKEDDSQSILVHECAPNGQGIVALIALNILREYCKLFGSNPKKANIHKLDSPEDADRVHVMIESLRIAFDAADGEVYERTCRQGDLSKHSELESQRTNR